MPTPHNNAAPGAFAKTVLMPGDPLRSKFIAETFLENPVLVNNVRGVQGYTGTYKGVPVSVMASGMGMPSIGIYAHELYTQYGVENIIRVGSAGAMRADLELGSVVAGQGACTNSSFADQYELGVHYAPIADFDLLMAAVESARELGVKMPVGNLYSSDTFYDAAGRNARMQKMGVMQACAGHLLHQRQSGAGYRAYRRRAPDHLHQHDEDRSGGSSKNDQIKPFFPQSIRFFEPCHGEKCSRPCK